MILGEVAVGDNHCHERLMILGGKPQIRRFWKIHLRICG